MRHGLRIATFHGTPIVLKPSVVLLAVLFGWAAPVLYKRTFLTDLAQGMGLDPVHARVVSIEVPLAELILVALSVVVGVLVSILVHELGHVLAARVCGIRTREVSLWGLGGMAQLERPPDRPTSEVAISAAGPSASLLLSGALFVLAIPVEPIAGDLLLGSRTLSFVVGYLAALNLLVALLNLLPGPVLDGGGIVRGLAWAITGNRSTSVRASGVVGIVGALLLFVLFLTDTRPGVIALDRAALLFGSVLMWWGSLPAIARGGGDSPEGTTPDVEDAVHRAASLSRHLGQGTIGATELLLAVLSHETDSVTVALSRYGITYGSVWSKVVELAAPPVDMTGRRPMLSETGKRMVSWAADVEQDPDAHGAWNARTALFFAVPSSSHAAHVVSLHGYDFSEVRTAVAAALELYELPGPGPGPASGAGDPVAEGTP